MANIKVGLKLPWLVEVVVWMLVHPSPTATLDIRALDENWASLQADEFMMINSSTFERLDKKLLAKLGKGK